MNLQNGGLSREHRRRARTGRRVGIALVGLLVLVFLTGYMAAYLPPQWFWWTGIVAPAVPYLAMLLAALAPLLLWRAGGRVRLAGGLVLLLILLRFAPPAGWVVPADERADDLTLMTFNAPVRGPHPDSLSRATIDLVDGVQPDLLALQEPVVMWDLEATQRRITRHVQALVDSLAYEAPVLPVHGAPTQLEQPVLSRFALDDVRQIVLAPGGLGTQRTYATRARFAWQGREAVLYNVHLHTISEKKPWHAEEIHLFDLSFWIPYLTGYREAYLQRVREVRHLRALIEEETLPIILTGDFNSTMHHWEYRYLARGLQNAFMQYGRGWGATYHSRLPLVRIDHVLVSPAWQVVSAHVPGQHAYSDHRPVVTRLRWRHRRGRAVIE